MDDKRFYIVRHGETLLNKLGKAQGWCDSPLTGKGFESAHSLGKELSKTNFYRAYCSDTIRARQTINSIMEQTVYEKEVIIEDERLREWCLGNYESMDNKLFINEIQEKMHCYGDLSILNTRLPEVAEIIQRNDSTGMAESFQDITTRLMNFLIETADNSPNVANLLVVTHAFAIKTILYSIAADKIGSLSAITNTSVTIVRYDGQDFHILHQ